MKPKIVIGLLFLASILFGWGLSASGDVRTQVCVDQCSSPVSPVSPPPHQIFLPLVTR